VRSFVLLAIVLGLAALPLPARAQLYDIKTIRFTPIRTGSPVVTDRFALANGRDACVAFHNTDARTAKTVKIVFAYYDDAGNRGGGDVFTRNGTFATGAETGISLSSNVFRNEDCIVMHQPRRGLSTIAYYIDHVDFTDGSSWSATDVTLPEKTSEGFAVVRSMMTPLPRIPSNLVPASAAATGTPLDPIVLESYPDCAAATATGAARTPLFAGDAVVAAGADRNVFVSAEPGASAGANSFHIGAVSVCVPSSDPLHDAAALEMVRAQPVSLNRAQVYRVYFPLITAAGSCTEDVRLLDRHLVSPSFALNETTPAPGDYTAIGHVDVSAGGLPSVAQIKNATGRRAYDEAARQSALASRYWPAITNGNPVAGTFEFAMRFTVAAGPDKATTRIFGAAIKPADPACVATR
jgi:hypothetical protein